MAGGFDWIAPFYDSIARLVFGESIRRCQLEYLDKIPPAANVLILGGGTGWIVEELFKLNPTCRVWYVEASIRMLEKARKTNEAKSPYQLVFLHGTERNLREIAEVPFDAVITNFYFDLFTTTSLSSVLESITCSINPGSKLLVSEFVEEVWWQRMLLFVMYRFFRWSASIEAARLPQWETELKRHGFAEGAAKTFYGGFIKSALYAFEPGS